MTSPLVPIWYQHAPGAKEGPERPMGKPRKFPPFRWSGKRDSDPRPSAWEGDELVPHQAAPSQDHW